MDNKREQGAALVITLILIFAVTLAVIFMLYLSKMNVLVSSNMAVQSAAQQATDMGLNTVSNLLANESLNPPTSNISPWFVAMTNPATRPTIPAQSFWQNCVANYSCGTTPVKYGPYNFNVYYVVYPIGPNANNSGYYYTAFIHAENAKGGGLGVTIQATLEK